MIIINLINNRTIREMRYELISVFRRKEYVQISCNVIIGRKHANDMLACNLVFPMLRNQCDLANCTAARYQCCILSYE